jgi:hypothetical protein
MMQDKTPRETVASQRSDVIVMLHPEVAWGEGPGFQLNLDLPSGKVKAPHTAAFDALAGDLGRRFEAAIRPVAWQLGEKSLGILREFEPTAGGNLDGERLARLLLFARVSFPAWLPPMPLVSWLSERPEVEVAYLEGGPQSPPAARVAPPPEPYEGAQDYLLDSPDGLGVRVAWGRPGGEGQGIGFVDFEKGWLFDHEDLVDLGLKKPLYGINGDEPGHGASVLGIVAAPRNHKGIVGLAPKLNLVGVASPYCDNGKFCCKPEVLSNVIEHRLNRGDVMLIEIQTAYNNQGSLLPVEVEWAVKAVLQVATFTHGITVVEAAGNNDVPLDTWEPPGLMPPVQPLNRNSGLDSGAVLVGAVAWDDPHHLTAHSNYGNRIDCVAWGNHVYTTGFEDDPATANLDHRKDYQFFSGTSSAAALIAGVAVLVQGMQVAKSRAPFDAVTLRGVLSDLHHGTACPTDGGAFVGLLPDLKKIIDGLGY